MVSSGWQQPAKCIHFGILGAIFSLSGHPEGHVWVCDCGKQFVVVKRDGKKTLVPKI